MTDEQKTLAKKLYNVAPPKLYGFKDIVGILRAWNWNYAKAKKQIRRRLIKIRYKANAPNVG